MNDENFQCLFCEKKKLIYLKFEKCNHKICQSCLKQELLNSTILQKKIKPKFEIPCKCNSSILSLTPNSLLTFLQSNTKIDNICSKHNLPFEHYCPNCRLWLCLECKKDFHNDYFSSHPLKNFNQIDEIDNNLCPIHNGYNFSFYCKTCKHSICKKEALNEHKDHWKVSFDDYMKQFKKFEKKWKRKNLNEFNNYIDYCFKKTINDIEESFNLIKEKIENIIDNFKKFEMNLTNNKINKITEIKTYIDILKNIYNFYYNRKEKIEKNRNDIKFLYKAFTEFKEIKIDSKIFKQNFQKIDSYFNELLNIDFFPINLSFYYHDNKNKFKKEKYTHCSKSISIKKNWVNCLVEINDDKIAAGCGDFLIKEKKVIKIFNLLNYKEEGKLIGHTNDIISLIYLKNGKLISGSLDNLIKIWNLNTFKEERTLFGHLGNVQCLLELNNNTLVSGSGDSTIKFWNLFNYSNIKTLKGHKDKIRAMIKLKDGRIASGSYDNTIKVWNLSNEKEDFTLSDKVDDVFCLIQLFNGNLASGSKDNKIKIWDLKKGIIQYFLIGHTDCVLCLINLKDGRLVSCGSDKKIKIWRVDNRREEITLEGHNDIVNCLIQLGNGKIVSCSLDRTIKFWN